MSKTTIIQLTEKCNEKRYLVATFVFMKLTPCQPEKEGMVVKPFLS